MLQPSSWPKFSFAISTSYENHITPVNRGDNHEMNVWNPGTLEKDCAGYVSGTKGKLIGVLSLPWPWWRWLQLQASCGFPQWYCHRNDGTCDALWYRWQGMQDYSAIINNILKWESLFPLIECSRMWYLILSSKSTLPSNAIPTTNKPRYRQTRYWIFSFYRSTCVIIINQHNAMDCYNISRVSCQKGPTRHAYAWQIGPFWQDTLDMISIETHLQHSSREINFVHNIHFSCPIALKFFTGQILRNTVSRPCSVWNITTNMLLRNKLWASEIWVSVGYHPL